MYNYFYGIIILTRSGVEVIIAVSCKKYNKMCCGVYVDVYGVWMCE